MLKYGRYVAFVLIFSANMSRRQALKSYSIEEDYLGEFLDPVNYDLEVGEQDPSHPFYIDLAKEVGGKCWRWRVAPGW